MELKDINFDCQFFKGHIPCKYNKLDDSVCPTCSHYVKITKKILIIKLAAIGDVIRTTPLLKAYKKLYPDCSFTWITLYPDILPKEEVDHILKLDAVSIYTVNNEEFDIAINLDKDKEACILLTTVKAKEKYGFTWENDHINIATPAARHKLITGLFDSISQQNTKSYLEEIFEICHLKFNYEEYAIRTNQALIDKWKKEIGSRSQGKKVVGLNTGCGARWKTRLWPPENWIALTNELEKQGYFCMLLGGKDEDELNKYYAAQTNAYYPGHFSLEEFISLSDSCDIIVTQVSMMMHIAVALKKQLILFNNIFNKHEFEMYGRGVIIEPTSGCDCYYGNTCKRDRSCMYDIRVDTVVKEIQKIGVTAE